VYVDTRGSRGFGLGDVPTNGDNSSGLRKVFADRTVTLAELPSGKAGTVTTLKHMRDFVHAAIRNPSQRIRNKALEIFSVRGVPPRAWYKEICALARFVRDEIRYVKDPVGVELVQTPEATLEIGQGDCDDKSTLLAALLMATGHPAKFIAVGMGGGPLSHVLVQAKCGAGWLPLETIIQKEPGWFPPGVTSKFVLDLGKPESIWS